MTIRRERSKFTLTCDGCGLVIQDSKWRGNKEAWGEAQSRGWIARPMQGKSDWTHYCPECKATSAAA